MPAKTIIELQALIERLKHGTSDEMGVAILLSAALGASAGGGMERLTNHVAKFAKQEILNLRKEISIRFN